MGHDHDVRCVVGEPSPGYGGFYRPAGGYVDLYPAGTVLPTEEQAAGKRSTGATTARKSWAYLGAEMAGRR